MTPYAAFCIIIMVISYTLGWYTRNSKAKRDSAKKKAAMEEYRENIVKYGRRY